MPGAKSKKDVSNIELLDFIKRNVFMKADFEDFKTNDFQPLKESVDEHTRILDSHTKSLDGLTKDVQTIKQELVFDRKRISRVEYRTTRLLGSKLAATDADFEEQYRGEERMRKQEAGG